MVGGVQVQAGRDGGRARLAAADHGADPGEQLADVEGLGQVVVAAGGEAREDVVQLVAGGQEQHRHVHAARAQRLADVAPVGVGQADVEDDGGEPRVRSGAGGGERAGAVRRGRHGEPALAEPAGDSLAQDGVVLHHEHGWSIHDEPCP